MAKLTKADRLKKYRDCIEQSLKWRKQEGYDDLWKRMVDLYRGKQYDKGADHDQAIVNLCFSTINVIHPTVSLQDPKFLVSPTKQEMIEAALMAEGGVNYWWRHYRFLPEWRQSVKDMLIIGHGWVKTGWLLQEQAEKKSADEIADEVGELLMQKDEAILDEGISEDELPSDDDVYGTVETTKMVTLEDRPFVERVSPFDMIIDPDATNEREMKWVAQRITMSWDEFKADKRFAAEGKRNAQATSQRQQDDVRPEQKASGDTNKYVCVYEYYDLRRRTMCVFADTGDGFLVEPQATPLPYVNPFTLVPNYEVPEYFYPIGDLESIEGLQQELNETRTQMFNYRKKYARAYLFRESAFSADGLKVLQSEDDNRMIPVTTDEDLRSIMQPVPQTQTPPEFFNQSDLIESDINQVSGVSEYQRGSLPDIRRTATEASIIQDTAQSRAADKLAQLEWRLAEVGYKLLALCQTYMEGEQVVRINGQNGQEEWVAFSPEDIQGEFDFIVEMGSTKPSNETARAQRAMQMMDALAPFAVPGGPMDIPELVKNILYSFGVREPERFLNPDWVDPMSPEGQMQQMGGMPPEGEMPMEPGMEQMPPEAMPPEGEIPPELLEALAAQGMPV